MLGSRTPARRFPPDQGRDPVAVGGRDTQRLENLGERRAECGRGDEVKLGEPVGVGGEQELVERRQLERFGEDRGGAEPDVGDGEPDVQVHVGQVIGQVRRLAVVGVAMQEQDGRTQVRGRAQEARQQRWVAAA